MKRAGFALRKLSSMVSRLLLLIPFGLGWLAGVIVSAARLTWAAVVEGYLSGNRL